jgi:hypothetical protein
MVVSTGSVSHQNIDTQVKRTPTDILDIEAQKVACVKLLKEGKLSYGRAKRKLSIAEISKWYDIHKEAVDFAVEHLQTHKIYLRMVTIKAAVATAYYSENPIKLARFCEVLMTGEGVNEVDVDALKLREWIIFNKDANSNRQYTVYFRTQQVIKKFCEGVVLRSISFRGQDPEYYLPENDPELEGEENV